MSWFKSQTEHLDKPQSILHLGAGACHELEHYQTLQPKQIFLVEPNPELVSVLRQKTTSMRNVSILDCGVSPKLSIDRLNVLVDPNFSSLYQPTGLYELMPGLGQPHQIQVDIKLAAKLVEELSLDQSQSNWLIVDTPGVEADVIADLNSAGQLEQFTRIFLWAGQEAFYEGAKTINEILTSLENLGYKPIGSPNQSDSDWPEYHLHLDKIFLKNRELNQEIEQLKEHQLSELIPQLEARQKELDQLTARQEAREQEVEQTKEINAQQFAKAQSEIQSLLTEKENQQKQINELSNTLEMRSTELDTTNARIESITAEKDNQQQQINDLSSALETRSAELDTTKALIESINAEKEKQQQQINDLSSALETRSAELDTVKALIESITAEKEKQQQQINDLSSALENRSTELDKANTLIESITAEKDNQQQQINDLSSALDNRSTELDKANTLIESITSEKDNQLQQLTDTLKDREKEISEMQQTVRINNKLILKSDTDLRDLQLQYRSALHHQEEQHTLLSELKEKLRQASVFYQKLNLQNLVIDSDALEQDDSDNDNEHEH